MRSMLIAPLGIVLALSLSGCDRKQAGAAPEPDPAATTDTQPAQSIIRPDFQEPEMQLPLAALELRIGFDDEGYELNDAAKEQLASIIESEQIAIGWPIVLRAHSDSKGNDRGNLAASQKRGEAVQDWLVENSVSEDRITLISFGEQNPAEPNALPDGTSNEAGRAANRRVEITIAEPDINASGSDNGEDAEQTETAE